MTELPAAAPAPRSYDPTQHTPGGVSMLGWVAAGVAVVALLVIWLGFGRDDETVEPAGEPPFTSASPSAPVETTPPPPVPLPVPAPGTEPPSPSPDPRPESDGGVPFTFPSALPSSFPTAIPTGLPSGFPTSLPPVPSPSAAPH